ncbi:DNA-3-methyladenine glycosylase [Phycisphaeraceae bacterium D3-23]
MLRLLHLRDALLHEPRHPRRATPTGRTPPRALQPVEGLDTMQRNRTAKNKKPMRDTDLCSGPAKLCQALAIDRDLNAADLCTGDRLWVEQARARKLPTHRIASGPRIGIDYAGDWVDQPLRFWVKGNPHVSK